MSKTYKFEAIKCAAGKFNFIPGKELDLAEDEAKELLADDAVRPLDPKMPASFYPKGKAPKSTGKKDTAASTGSTTSPEGDGDK